jgi:hypothetical protein
MVRKHGTGATARKAADMSVQSRPDCYRCKHYYVTWDASFPYGCKGFEMKSKVFPSLSVFEASGARCMLFVEKQRLRKR